MNRPGIGIYDNFFELGGHSLLAARILSRVRESFSAELTLKQMLAAPTIAELGALLAGETRRWTAAPITVVDRSKPIPASLAQQRMWFVEQIERGGQAYHMPFAFRLEGELNNDALAAALEHLISRHEILRTCFPTVDGLPVQHILPPARVTPVIADLSPLSAPDRERAQAALLLQVNGTPFDLETGPLFRVALVRLGSEEHGLFMDVHHLLFDAWSIQIFSKELLEVYEAFCRGQGSPLAPLPVQYADFAAWQRALTGSRDLEAQAAYWRGRLQPPPPALQLPQDASADADYRGAKISLVLPRELGTDLARYAQDKGVTLFVTVLAAFKVLLYRLTGVDDITLGAPVAGRPLPETETMIGLFLNTLVLRTDLSGNPNFDELLDRVRETVLDAHANGDIPFEKLVSDLQPERSLDRHPFFDLFFNFITSPQSDGQRPGIRLCPLEPEETVAKFPLTLYVEERDSPIRLSMVYRTALFSKQRMEGFLRQYEKVLAQIVEDGQQSIEELSLVDAAFSARIPRTDQPIPEVSLPSIAEIFEDLGAGDGGKRIAVETAQGKHDYAELNSRSKDLARQLVYLGLERGQVVAVFGYPSFGLVACMTAVLRGGGVLLNLDPDLPAQRHQVMLRESDARLLLLAASEGQDLGLPGLTVLRVDPATAQSNLACPSQLPSPFLPEGDDPAYVFFTSGTTGTPKGVLGRHKGLIHFLAWQRDTFSVGPDDRAAQLTNLSFDVVLRDIFLPLTSGATLCLPPGDGRNDPARIIPWMWEARITVAHTVPSLATSWLAETAPQHQLADLRLTFFAGEPLPEKLVQDWRTRCPACRVINLYGPTETTLAKCFAEVPDPPFLGMQPVGLPLPQTQAMVLRPNGTQVGMGEQGEVVIRTPYRSLGYLNAGPEDLHRFSVNPATKNPDDLLYYTGDRGRLRPDGQLEITGRLDHQVKILGVRIEPGEVQTQLVKHDGVREAAVIVREDRPGDKRLVAYVVETESGSLEVADLRRFASERLPRAMIPAAIVVLERLPLTPNGKLDRKRLPEPARQTSEALSTAPQDVLELTLQRIWEEILGLSPIGLEDDFFSLGGHSLLAIRLQAAIARELDRHVPLQTFFEATTIRQLAAKLRPDARLEGGRPLVAIQPHGSAPPLFFAGPLGGTVLCYVKLSRLLGKDIPFYGLQSPNIFREQPLQTMADLADALIEEIKTVRPQGPWQIGGWSFGGVLAYEIARRLSALNQSSVHLFILDSSAPLTGPDKTPHDEVEALAQLIREQAGPAGEQDALSLEALRAVAPGDLIDYVIDRLGDRDGTFSNKDQWQILWRVFNLNAAAFADFRPETFPGRIDYFKAREGTLSRRDAAHIWRGLGEADFVLHSVPGSHHSMIQPPHVEELAEALREVIE